VPYLCLSVSLQFTLNFYDSSRQPSLRYSSKENTYRSTLPALAKTM
jgi:hypothetical protein